MKKKKISVLTGAGISAESGIPTYRDADGLWEGYDFKEVATPMAWAKDPELVLRFYNERRRQMRSVAPNPGHQALVELEQDYEVAIITQNIDDLHERAGSSTILHLHGEIVKSRSAMDEDLRYDCPGDIEMGDTAEDGAQLRPHVVWFGEDVPEMTRAVLMVAISDIVVIVGTSMAVYPANTLVEYAPEHAEIYFIDPKEPQYASERTFQHIRAKASVGVPQLVAELKGRVREG